MSVDRERIAVFDAFDQIIREGYRGRAGVRDIAFLPTPTAAVDRLIDAAFLAGAEQGAEQLHAALDEVERLTIENAALRPTKP